MKIIFAITGIAAAIFLVATIYLLYLNWNQNLLGRALTIFLVGIVTILTTIVFSLKESSINNTFLIPIYADSNTNTPLVNIAKEGYNWTIDFGSLLANITKEKKDKYKEDGAIDTNADILYYQELLQYVIVKYLLEFQDEHFKIMHGTEGVELIQRIPYELATFSNIPSADIIEIFSVNQFYNMDVHKWPKGHKALRLPHENVLKLVKPIASEKRGKHRIILYLKNFYSAEITIETYGATEILDELGAPLNKAFVYRITMKSDFDKITSQNPQSEEYKKWFEWLYSEIEKHLVGAWPSPEIRNEAFQVEARK